MRANILSLSIAHAYHGKAWPRPLSLALRFLTAEERLKGFIEEAVKRDAARQALMEAADAAMDVADSVKGRQDVLASELPKPVGLLYGENVS